MNRLLVTGVVALVAAYCAATATTMPSLQQRRACGGAARGLKMVSVPKGGFRLGVPRSWRAMTGEEYARALGAGYGKAFTDPSSPLKLFALACEPGRAYPSTLSVIVLRKTRTWSFSDFEHGTLRALRESAVSGGAPKAARFHVRVGRALRIRAVIRARGAKTPLASTTYLVQTRRAAYMISYATVRELSPSYAHVFDESVRSLREL